MKTPAEVVRELLDEFAPELRPRTRQALERKIFKALVVPLVQDGYSLKDAAGVLGIAETNPNTWKSRDPEFATAIEQSRDDARAKLRGLLWRHAEDGNAKASSSSINVLANLIHPELRHSKVDNTHAAAPLDPAETRKRILDRVNKGKPVDGG